MISKQRQRKGIIIVPDTDALESIEGEIKVDSADGKLKATLGGSAREILTNSQTQSLTNKTFDADGTGNSITNIENADIKAAAAIDASKLADGSVSNAEFQYLANVTSDIQAQINTASGAAGTAQTDINNHIADTADAHDASAISNVPSGNLAATEVQAALNELQSDVDTRATSAALSAHISNATGAHAASAISNTPSGNLVATEVQAALNELQTDVDTRALNSDLTTHTGASTGVHGVTGSVVGTSDSQVLTNKTITGADIRTPIRSDVKQDTKANLTTYATTASNGQIVFATDTKEYLSVKDGLLSAIGSGGGVGNINALLTQTFDLAALTDFTQTGLELVTTNIINGAQSARLIHQAGSSRSFKQVVAVDRKYRSEPMQLSLQVRSSASNGNLTLLVTDETNSATIAASQSISTGYQTIASLVTNATTTVSGFSNSVINGLSVGMTVTGSGIATETLISAINTTALTITLSQAATASATVSLNFSALPDRRTFSFIIPANCASMSYTITALQEANAPESYIDDVVIELASTALLSTSVDVPNMTAWNGYTPTFQGFGTPTNVEFEWRQVGENVEIRGKFTSGTSTAVEARVGLPAGLTSGSTALIPSIQVAGIATTNDVGATSSYFTLIEPSVTYVTFGQRTASTAPLSKANGSSYVSSVAFNFTASVPCAGLSATSTKTIALTQSGLVQSADSMVILEVFNAYGTTATKIPRFSTINSLLGSSVLYQDSVTNGASFTALVDGTYTFELSFSANTTHGVGLTKNSSSLTTNIASLTGNQVLARSIGLAGNTSTSVTWTGKLTAGDVIRPHTDGVASSGGNQNAAHMTVAYQGSLKQVSVNPDSKITIPTSELRFEGASSRGAVATAIVKFDTLAKIRGDAFTVTNTAADGTFVTMLKAGKLDVSTSIFSNAANQAHITRNQSNLTALSGIASEILSSEYSPGAGDVVSPAWSGFVNIGDIIRVNTSAAISALSSNNLNLSFQEQDIAVSVTNTLPQFSESDTSLRLSGANGFGSTATTTRRFSSVLQNIGTDVEYIDSPTLGGQFIAKASGIYNVSFSEQSSSNVVEAGAYINLNGVVVNGSRDTVNTAVTTDKLPTASWSGYLSIGDVITAVVSSAANNNGVASRFTISKVGKPNVTGVDVTPFVNVPQPVSGTYHALVNSSYNISSTLKDARNGLFTVDDTVASNRIRITALSQITVTASGFFTCADGTYEEASVAWINSSSQNLAANAARTDYLTASITATASASTIISAGDYIEVSFFALAGGNGGITITATALSDQILTAPETFSTDTASLQYASSAAYTLTTLTNAPVGTYITFTYAINTNTRTQTTTRPTQTDADMNANGIQITARAYNVASTAAAPAAVAIQIGKGLKGVSQNLYKSAGKVTAGNLDYVVIGATNDVGAKIYAYNELTGILIVDAGTASQTTVTAHSFTFSDDTAQNSGYLVINASKNPALTGIGLNRIAARGVNSAGTTFGNAFTALVYNTDKTFDTNGALNAATGVFTAPETGFYELKGNVNFNSALYAVNNIIVMAAYKNGVVYGYMGQTNANTAGTYVLGLAGSTIVFLRKGETVEIRILNERGSTAISASATVNSGSFIKVSV